MVMELKSRLYWGKEAMWPGWEEPTMNPGTQDLPKNFCTGQRLYSLCNKNHQLN